MDRESLLPVIRNALDKGAKQTGLTSWSWDVAGRCSNPVYVNIEGRPLRKGMSPIVFCKTGGIAERAHLNYGGKMQAHTLSNPPAWLDMKTPCRKCPECQSFRRALWRERVRNEITVSQRTWFGTLTLRPECHYLTECRAPANFSELSAAEQFAERCRIQSEEVTRYWKRVRKSAEGRLRVCLVAEPHKNGLPHYHAVVHETHGSLVTKAILQDAWHLGFSKWKLVDDADKASWYVAKYLTKTVGARVRASLRYGDVRTALAVEGKDSSAGLPREKPPPQKKGVSR